LAATKVAYEEYFRSIGVLKENEFAVLEELPMVVNGDDILYWCYSQEHYTIWKEVTKQCGLKFSLGKNYTHKRVAIINSELYFFNPSIRPQVRGQGGKKEGQSTAMKTTFIRMGALPPNPLFTKVAAVNSRLLIGGQRSTGMGGNTEIRDIALLTEQDISILAAELRAGKTPPLKYTGGELGERQRQKYNSLTTDDERLSYLQYLQRKVPERRTQNLEEYLKWRMTVEARGQKGREMIAGDYDVDRARPAMMRAFTSIFNKIQIAKLVDFRKVGLENADVGTPYYLPRSLGGLGLIPPPDHQFTAMEVLEVATLEGCVQSADKYLRRITPAMPKPDFMKAVSHELNLQKDLLAIKKEFKEDEDIGLLRFLGEDDGFWEHSFLLGFVSEDAMIVDPYELGEAYVKVRNTTRAYKNEALMREKARQYKQGEMLGIWTKVHEDDKLKVKETSAGVFHLAEFNVLDSTILRTYRPSPKYE